MERFAARLFYGRDVGYVVERIEIDAATHAVFATDMRRKLFNVVE